MLVLSSGCLNSHGVLWLVAAHQDGLNGTHCLHYITFFSPGVSLETMSLRGRRHSGISGLSHTHTHAFVRTLSLHTDVRGHSSADQALHTFRPLCHVSVMCVCVWDTTFELCKLFIAWRWKAVWGSSGVFHSPQTHNSVPHRLFSPRR